MPYSRSFKIEAHQGRLQEMAGAMSADMLEAHAHIADVACTGLLQLGHDG